MSVLKRNSDTLYQRIAALLDDAKARAIQNVNTIMVQSYWAIGQEIVQAEQKGKKRAAYGKALIEMMSQKLTLAYGTGWSASHLWHIRQFHLLYRDRKPLILHTLRAESFIDETLQTLHPDLSWSHYRILMRIENESARSFYEIECAENRWSVRELERQKGTFLYERLAVKKDAKAISRLSQKGHEIQSHNDLIKDPYIPEFTGLSPVAKLYESSLEQALCDNLSRFLLELGKGFTFVARQKRIALDGDHFYIDLVFYNTILKCYVLADLKTGKLTH